MQIHELIYALHSSGLVRYFSDQKTEKKEFGWTEKLTFWTWGLKIFFLSNAFPKELWRNLSSIYKPWDLENFQQGGGRYADANRIPEMAPSTQREGGPIISLLIMDHQLIMWESRKGGRVWEVLTWPHFRARKRTFGSRMHPLLSPNIKILLEKDKMHRLTYIFNNSDAEA